VVDVPVLGAFVLHRVVDVPVLQVVDVPVLPPVLR
jgi:hypothetical protein